MKIILISVDTLRADHLGCYGYLLETTPVIDKLAREGVLFAKHYSTDVPTPPAYTAMFCGKRGLHTGIFGFGHTNWSSAHGGSQYNPSLNTPLLAEYLAEAGYRTGMISNLLYPCPWLVKGFQEIIPPGLRFQGGTADEVTESACKWLERNAQEDFFLFVHYWDPHVNYFARAPQRYQDLFSGQDYSGIASKTGVLEEYPMMKEAYLAHFEYACNGESRPEKMLMAYDACIKYADDGIGRLLDYLDKIRISDEVLLIFTSDHGEAFGERGFFDHHTSYENIAHVPLIVRWPKRIPAGKTVEGYTLCVDLMPTILDLCGLPAPKDICGRSLVETIVRGKKSTCREVVTNGAGIPIQRMYIKEDWALVHTLDRSICEHLNSYELFNLREDKAQEKDLAEMEKAKFSEMKMGLDQWLDRELKGKLDLFAQIVSPAGGWMFSNIERAFYKNPKVFLEDKRARELIISRLGSAALKYADAF